MTTASDSRVLHTIPLLILIYLFTLPAHAKYNGGTGIPDDPCQIAKAKNRMLLGDTSEH